MQRPELLLADEPTSSLDPRTAIEIMELMTGLSTSARIPLVVNIHNVDLARRFAQRVIGMAGGEIVFDGPPEKLEASHLRQIYGGEDWL
jgi:phosphonate transport system ATP-binding protein